MADILEKENDKTIAIDMNFISGNEARTGDLFSSFSIVMDSILHEFVLMNVCRRFCLVANYYIFDFVKNKYPEFRVIMVGNFPFRCLYSISRGRIKLRNVLYRTSIYDNAVAAANVYTLWFPRGGNGCPRVKKTKYVTTIHDLIVIHNMDNQASMGTNEVKKDIYDHLANASKIVAISEYVRNDICKTFSNIEKKDLMVVQDPVLVKANDTRKEADKKYILDVNGYGLHKNPMTLLKAYEIIKDKTDLDLIFCGAWKHENCVAEMDEYISSHGLSNRVKMLFCIPRNELEELFDRASLFVDPSLDEGFGLPPIEAAIKKIPVISTNEASLYESTMGLLRYVSNAYDERELSDVMLDLIEHPVNRLELDRISETLGNKYKPSIIAGKYLQIFEETIEEDDL